MDESKNLVLTGLMGTGKSTVGRLLANTLQRNFIDTDTYIERYFGPVSAIFKKTNGNELFSDLEQEVAHDLASKSNLVIATGGRFLINQTNINVTLRNGQIICLTADLEDLVDRLLTSRSTTFRPRFLAATNKLELMKTLYRQSKPYYSQFPQIQTTGLSPASVANRILEQVMHQR